MKKSKTWRQLNQGDRDRIQLLLEKNIKQKDIAHILEVDPSRICREIKKRKKKDGIYNATVAHHKAQIARGNSKYQGMKIEQNQVLKRYIVSELKDYQSPECIAGKMKEVGMNPKISSDAIYRWLRSSFGQRYCKYLCTKRYKKKQHKDTPERQMIQNMTSIHDIPKNPGIVTEGDTMLSPKKESKTSAVIVVWRETKLLKGDLVKSLRPVYTTKVMKKINSEYKNDAMILDRGSENREHHLFGVSTYFCDSGSPRQKPLIENSIGQLRRWFFPKGTDLSKISKEEFQEKLEIMNNKYKKSLRYKSANEASRDYGILK